MENFTLKYVEELIDCGIEESGVIEYKSRICENKDIAKEICAFANSYGGTIIFGINCNDRKPISIEWLTGGGKEELLQNVSSTSIQPKVVDVGIHKITRPDDPNQFLIIATIPQSKNAPHMVDGRFYSRSGSQSRPMNDIEVKNSIFGQGRKEVLRQELIANVNLAERSLTAIDTILQKQISKRLPLLLVPLYTEGWLAVITSGATFTLAESNLQKWMDTYRLIYEINTMIFWLNTRDTIIIHTNVDPNTLNCGTYLPSIIRNSLEILMKKLTELIKEWD
jgi:Predicted transcriptional regulator containing an HTH domain and an uncharacterized domain shared with the mammalian protein Schlafen